MSIVKQRAINKQKIAKLTKLLEAETKKEVVLEAKNYRLKPTEENIKKAINTIVSKKISGGEALLLLQSVEESSYVLEDTDIQVLFKKYGLKLDYGGLTGGMEQLLDKIGYVLKASDVGLLSTQEYGYSGIGSILAKLFYSGKAQRFISDEFIKAVAVKMTNTKNHQDVLDTITGGDPVELPQEYAKRGGQFYYFQDRSKPIIAALEAHGGVIRDRPKVDRGRR